MDLLKLELDKKRKAIELAKNSSEVGKIGNNDPSEKSRSRTYLKAADVRRFQEKRQEQEEAERRKAIVKGDSIDGNGNKRRKHDDPRSNQVNKSGDENMTIINASSSKTVQRVESSKKQTGNSKQSAEVKINVAREKDTEQSMSSLEISQALRELGIPVWLFGERNDIQRLERLKEAKENRKAAMMGLSEMDEYRLGSGHGIRNPFIGKNKDEDQDSKQKQQKDEKPKESSHNKTLEMVEDSDDPHKTIHSFFKNLLHQWEDDLANRPDAIKRTAAGKNETKTLKQCKDYIRPLFKLCKNRTLEESIMGSILKIVNFCKEGEFVKANDAYMDVAIGRAAWPIGVTMVGIHQRTGRERINAEKVAHVMNSELQRKYLTSVKRLITFCQKKRPDVDPSKKVINV